MNLMDMLGLNKGKGTIKAAETNQGLLSALDPRVTGYLDESNTLAGGVRELGATGANAYADALGLNGPEGNANAVAGFKTGPGYDFMMDQGLQALERRASAQGNLQSGETGLDTLRFATGLAGQEWGGYLDRLQPYNGMFTQGTGMEMGTLSDLGGWAGDFAGAQMGANNQIAAGEEAGQGSLWDLLNNVGSVAGSVAGAFTGMPSFGGKGGSIAGGAKKTMGSGSWPSFGYGAGF